MRANSSLCYSYKNNNYLLSLHQFDVLLIIISCDAILILSLLLRCHSVQKDLAEVAAVFRVCTETLKNRLREFRYAFHVCSVHVLCSPTGAAQ